FFAHVANALYRNGFSSQAVHAPEFFGAGFHAHVHTVSRNRGWIAAPSYCFGNPYHVFGFHAYKAHVFRIGTDVAADDELAVQAVHVPSEASQKRLGFVLAGVPDDDRAASAQV